MLKQTSLRRVRVRIIRTPGRLHSQHVLVRSDEVVQDASFIFPFFDGLLAVRFLLIIMQGKHFLLHDSPHHESRMLIVPERRLAPLEASPPDLFHRHFHFDPWWAMRGATGIPMAVRQAVIASNIAARRYGHLVIRDLVFSNDLAKVEEVRVGDGVFRSVSYNQGRPMPWLMQEAFFGKHQVAQARRG